MNNISIILVNPQMGENIGASARAMKNFGLKDLRIVAPRDGWPNEKARNMSVGALDLIEAAKLYDNLPAALGDLEYVYATTASSRDMNKNYVLSRGLSADIPPTSNVGIMFGRENCGLNNAEISYANKILTIDTDLNFTSLNIAHAVAVVCYEIWSGYNKQVRRDLCNKQELANANQMEYFYNYLFAELEQHDFFRVPEKKEQMQQKIRNIFTRIEGLSSAELQILMGTIKALSKQKE